MCAVEEYLLHDEFYFEIALVAPIEWYGGWNTLVFDFMDWNVVLGYIFG